MKKMTIYEPAMCCETGLCGVGVDPELLRISAVVSAAHSNGVSIERFNLNSSPMAFVNNKTVNDYINKEGADGLPIVLVDDEIVITKRYPTNEEITDLLEISKEYLTESTKETNDCCSGGTCC